MPGLVSRVTARLKPAPAPDLRFAVGGLWEEMGNAQLAFLKSQGMQPGHRLLDVGCGTLRGGVKFIPYLDPGNYFGIDLSQEMLDAGLRELEGVGAGGRDPHLRQTETFDMDFGVPMDYAIAQSVFTHIPLNSILRCVLNVQHVLAPEGRFYATFFENTAGKNSLEPLSHPQPDHPPLVTHMDRDVYHYDLSAFEWACSGTALQVEYIGEWGSLRGQKMLLFTRRPGA